MISAYNLTKIFDDKAAIDNITFDISDGAIYGLIGSNGSGKSTLMRLMSGVYSPDKGSINIDGRKIFDNPYNKSKIAYLGDTPYFLPHSTIRDMSKFYETMYPNFDYKIYNRLVEIFPLDYKSKIATMSKGMQRQAALILSISTSPRFLLLDEAFDGLDVVMRKVLKNILIEGSEERKMTTVIASHNLRELEDLCDNVGLIHKGNLIVDGEVEKIKGNIHKVQAAFKSIPEKGTFSNLDILKIERSGSLLQMVIRGNEQQIMNYIRKLNPVFSECIEPTLEEIFMCELEVTGYDVKSIIN